MCRYVTTGICLLILPVLATAADKAPAPIRGLDPLVRLLTTSDNTEVQRDILRGMCEALRGRRQLAAPDGWASVKRKLADSRDSEVRERALLLSVLLGDPEAVASLRRMAADPKAEEAARRTALQTLTEAQAPDLLPLLRDLLADRAMRGPALRALAAQNDSGTPALILQHYASFNDAEKVDAIATLASRPAYALALLDAMEHGDVPRRDLSVFTVRQLLALKDPHLTDRITKVWGSIRPTSQDKAALMARYQGLVPPDALKNADRSHGRLVFSRTCATCHTLFGEGGKIGPDLTGSQRTNPEFVLSKVLDPSAVVAKDYQMTIIATSNGRVLNGLVKEETEKTLLLQTQNELVTLAKSDIDDRQRSPLSMMPEGLLAPLNDGEVRDLFAYLAGSGQVALPPGSTPGKPAPKSGEAPPR
jgi:putative heme-binding domain-containing protein